MSDRLMQSPRLYAMFLLWLLSELFEQLPEVGDPDKPVLVFFFDEAHLLFTDAPKALTDKVVQVVRLIRSKGVGVYFCTQNPDDVPRRRARPARQPRPARAPRLHPARRQGAEAGGRDLPPQPRVRHRDRDPRGAAPARRWCRCSRTKGVPAMVSRTLIRPPESRMGPITAAERARDDRRLAARRQVRDRRRPRVGAGDPRRARRARRPRRRRWPRRC